MNYEFLNSKKLQDVIHNIKSILHVLEHTTFSLMSADKEEISEMHTTTKETVIVIHELKRLIS